MASGLESSLRFLWVFISATVNPSGVNWFWWEAGVDPLRFPLSTPKNSCPLGTFQIRFTARSQPTGCISRHLPERKYWLVKCLFVLVLVSPVQMSFLHILEPLLQPSITGVIKKKERHENIFLSFHEVLHPSHTCHEASYVGRTLEPNRFSLKWCNQNRIRYRLGNLINIYWQTCRLE